MPVTFEEGYTRQGNANGQTAWATTFWAEIHEPSSGQRLFVQPETGQVKEQLDAGTIVLPETPDSWWELETDDYAYYYNALSRRTTWSKPEGLIIPFSRIQRENQKTEQLQNSSKSNSSQLSSILVTSTNTIQDLDANLNTPALSHSASSSKESSLDEECALETSPSMGTLASSYHTPRNSTDSAVKSQHTRSLSLSPIGSISCQDPTTPKQKARDRKTRNLSPLTIEPETPSTPKSKQRESPITALFKKASRSNLQKQINANAVSTPSPVKENGKRTRGASMPGSTSDSPRSFLHLPFADLPVFRRDLLYVSQVSTRSLSTPAVFESCASLASPIQTSAWRTHQSSKDVKDRKKTAWEQNKLGDSVQQLPKALRPKAMACFLLIEDVLNDDTTNARFLSTEKVTFEQAKAFSLEKWPSTRMHVAQNLIASCLASDDLRHHILIKVLCQMKQAIVWRMQLRAWQLLAILLYTFPPAKACEGDFDNAMECEMHRCLQDLPTVDRHFKICRRKLNLAAARGRKCRPPSESEIQHILAQPFDPNCFGESLPNLMAMQARTHPDAQLPLVLVFLCTELDRLGALSTPNIFRQTGDHEEITALKARLDSGWYFSGSEGVHTVASVLKAFIRELDPPLISESVRRECMQADGDSLILSQALNKLPLDNRRVLYCFVCLLRRLVTPEVQEVTRMTAESLATILAPTLLQQPTQSLSTAHANARFEQKVVLDLIQEVDFDQLDLGEFKPEAINSFPQGPWVEAL